MKQNAVLKNIGFTNVTMNGITLLTRTTNGTISNIYVQYKKSVLQADKRYLLAETQRLKTCLSTLLSPK